MKRRTNDWLVGSVVLGAMVLTVAATMFLQQSDIGKRRESITARFRDVGNLSIGNSVVIRGVRAGRVENIALADRGWVTARLTLDPGIQLPPDPVVLIQAATLFGEWHATITQRDAVPAIREVVMQLADTVDTPPETLPGAVLPDIAQLTSVAGGIAGNVASVSERVRVAFDDEAARELRATIRNVSEMSKTLTEAVRVQSRNLDLVAVQVREGVGDLAAGAAALQRSITRLDSATAGGEIQRIVRDAEVASVNLREATQRLNDISRSMERAERSLLGVLSKADTVLGRVESGAGSLGLFVNDPSLYRNSDSLMVDLRTLINDMRANPRRYMRLSIF